jgi:general secretion pathway protein A
MLPIYCSHFGFTREPFNVTADPALLYLSESHEEALAQLVYGINTRRGFIVLTGEVGTGKSTLIQKLLDEMKECHTRCAYVFHLTGGPKDLLRSLCREFALVSALDRDKDIEDYLALLNQFLRDCYQRGDNVAVIIDEAQNLSTEVLERVRLLSNLETQQDKLLQILLIGQPELSDRLNDPALRQLKQRVALRHQLSPLSPSECQEYIAKRLEIAGGDLSLFPTEAVDTVYSYSGGIPRLINILCDNGLLAAYGSRKPCVDAEMIAGIAHDLHLSARGRQANGARQSAGAKAAEAPLRETRNSVLELTDVAQEAPPPSGLRRLFGLSLKAGSKAGAPNGTNGAHSGANGVKPPKNGAAAKAEDLPPVVPERFFQTMSHVLDEAIGPIAVAAMEDQIAVLGETRNAFPTPRLSQLVIGISREIRDDSIRTAFLRRMSDEYWAIYGNKHAR